MLVASGRSHLSRRIAAELDRSRLGTRPIPARSRIGLGASLSQCRGAMVESSSARTTRAGPPMAREFGGMLRVTTEPAPITQLLPIVTSGHTMTPPPSQTLSPIAIGSAD